jgi:hypothetical protein
MAELNDKFEFEQDGKIYNLYDLPDGFVVEGNLSLRNKHLTELPDLSEVVVNGNFDCSCNNLTSLKGAPQKVGGKFDCGHNIFLESLYGISEMAEDGKIHCSGELNERYGFIEGKVIRYKELLESSTYKTEARIHEILSKRHTKENEAAKEQRQTQIKAGYAAFKKMKTEERE